MQAWLQVSHPRANLSKVRLLPQTLVGRSPECHLRIATPLVSRRHCRFTLQSDGVYIEDLASANGTLLDGIRLPVLTPTYVRPEAVVDIGPARFIVIYATHDLDEGLPGQPLRDASDPAVPGPWLIGSGPQVAEEGTIELQQPEVTAFSRKPVADGTRKPAGRGSIFGAFFGRSKPRKPAPVPESQPIPPVITPATVSPSRTENVASPVIDEHDSEIKPPESEPAGSGNGDQALDDFLNKLG